MITDATRNIHKNFCCGSHWSRNVKSANHFQTIFKKGFFVGILNAAIHSICPNNPAVLETWYSGEGGVKNSIDVNEQMLHMRDFYREEEIASLIVLGLCLWHPEGFVNYVNSCADECMRVPFRQAAVRAPLIIWSGPDCRKAGGRYIRRVWGQHPFQLTGLWRLQHTCGLKIDSLLLCI